MFLWALGMHVSFWISVFVFFRYISTIRIAGSYGSSMFSSFFLFLSFFLFFVFCFLSFVLFLGLHSRHTEVPRLGSIQSCCCRPTPQPQQSQIWAASATYTTALGNAGSLTHWARPGNKATTSWFLVRFVSAEPRREVRGTSIRFSMAAMPIYHPTNSVLRALFSTSLPTFIFAAILMIAIWQLWGFDLHFSD